ncbi:MAG: aminotransferase class V-fold PLP-dependent enzyme [Cyanobacteria bacterium]|nr:aminotransferase class V-fold PLP-dependent enzyme [Cyanobacteriota bacterium]
MAFTLGATPPDSEQLRLHRQQFPALENKSYFNYGGQGPMPAAAIAAMHAAHLKLQQQGPFSATVNRWLQKEAAATRVAIAQQLGVTTDTIALTESVTGGCNIPLWGLDWQAGDRILMSDCEHQGIIATVQEISRRFGVAIDVFPLLNNAQGSDPVAVIDAHLQPRTRLLIISHVLWNTGQVLPLTEIVQLCHQRPQPTWVLVDAAQSVGMLPLNLGATEVDFYAFTGHKWCCGPAGLGGYYGRAELRDRVAPTYIGWRGITVDGQGQPTGWEIDNRRYEVATSDYALMPGLRTAWAMHDQWGNAEARYQRICHLSRYLWEALQGLPQVRCLMPHPPASGLISFQILAQGKASVEHSAHLAEDLETGGILIRTLRYPSCVRACVHYFTLEAELDHLVEAIKDWVTTHCT